MAIGRWWRWARAHRDGRPLWLGGLALAPRVDPGDVERRQLVGRLEPEDLAEERQSRLERTADRRGAPEPVALALEGEVGVGDLVALERLDDLLGLRRR